MKNIGDFNLELLSEDRCEKRRKIFRLVRNRRRRHY